MMRDVLLGRFRAGTLSQLLRLAGPVILARLGIMTMGLTDAIVVGRHSAVQLSYHALAWAPTGAVLVGAVGLLTGVQVMTARLIGAGLPQLTGAVLRRGLVYGFWVGLACAIILIVAGPAFLHLLPLDEGLARGATPALRIFALSMPPYLMSVAASFYLEALSKPKAGMVIMWIANAVNLGLNLLLVPGALGLPAMGAAGAACATLGSRTFLALALIAYVALLPQARALGVFTKPQRRAPEGVEQRRIGYAAGVSYFVEGGAFSAMSFIAGTLGALQVAAWAVVLNVAAIIFMVPLGLATATAVLVGRAYGAGDRRGMVRAGVLGLLVSAVISLVVIAVVWPGSMAIAGAYSSDPALMRLASAALVLSCLFYLADGLQAVAAQALRARGDIWPPTAIHILSYAVVMGPLAWILAVTAHMGLKGVVWAVSVASLASGATLVGRFLWMARRA